MIEIAKAFLRMGFLGFGGPIAIVAMMQDEFCERRRWLTRERFAEAYALLKIMPGPISTQMAVFLGSIRAGAAGGVLAGLVFILPAFFLVLGLSILYARGGAMLSVGGVFSGFFSGLQLGAIGVIFATTIQLGTPYAKTGRAWAVGVLSGLLILLAPRWEPVVILAFGLAGAWIATRRKAQDTAAVRVREGASLFLGLTAAAAALLGISGSVLCHLFWSSFKAGAFTFGTGLAIVPLLEADTVGRYHWLTHSQFMDGLAIGQVTPGPVVITVTFIGYLAAGVAGAVAATLGIFLPSFVNVGFILPRIWRRVSGTPEAEGFAAWAIPSVVGGIAGTTFKLALLVVTGWIPGALLATAAFVAIRLRPPAWLLIPAAGVAMAGLSLWK